MFPSTLVPKQRKVWIVFVIWDCLILIELISISTQPNLTNLCGHKYKVSGCGVIPFFKCDLFLLLLLLLVHYIDLTKKAKSHVEMFSCPRLKHTEVPQFYRHEWQTAQLVNQFLIFRRTLSTLLVESPNHRVFQFSELRPGGHLARAHFVEQFVCFLNALAALQASQRVLLSATDDTLSLVSLTAHLYSLNTHMCWCFLSPSPSVPCISAALCGSRRGCKSGLV